jgi:hypothetical protein
MPLYINNAEAEELARQLAAESGETITDVVIGALRDRRDSLRRPTRRERVARLNAIADHAAALANGRTVDIDELYDDDGLPR